MAVAWSHRPIPSGTHDILDRLLIPEKLYGREVNALLGAFDRVVAHGAPELVLVSGYSGGGKSSVVNELHKELVLSITMRPDRPRAWENWAMDFRRNRSSSSARRMGPFIISLLTVSPAFALIW